MQPRPMRDTSSSLSLMCFTVAMFPSRVEVGWVTCGNRRTCQARFPGRWLRPGRQLVSTAVALGRCWHEPEGRGSRLWADDGVDDAGGVAAVLGAVGGVDLLVQVIDLDQAHVFVDAAGLDVAFVADLGATEPGGGAAVDGPDIEVVAVADDPDGPGVAQGAVASTRGNLQLVG